MADTPNFIDLDDVAPEVDLTVKLDGEQHKLHPLSVEGFVLNMKDQKKLQQFAKTSDLDDPDVVTENISVVIRMLTRSFPTLTEEKLRKVPLAKLWKLLNFARSNDGSQAVDEPAPAGAEENPQTAG